jgi:hypothetical protein
MGRKMSTYSPERVALLQWTGRMGAVTADALAHREGSTVAAARARLLAAERDRQATRQRPLAGQPALFALTRAGLRDSGLQGLEPCRVSAANASHAIACVQVAATLERAYPHHRLVGERELRRDERLSGAPLASARLGTGPDGATLLHRPDLVLWPGTHGELPVAVEVELTTKSPRRLAEICQAWARCRQVAGVLYLAAPEVTHALARAIAKANAEEAIVVLELDAASGSQLPSERTIPGAA